MHGWSGEKHGYGRSDRTSRWHFLTQGQNVTSVQEVSESIVEVDKDASRSYFKAVAGLLACPKHSTGTSDNTAKAVRGD